MAIKLFSYYFKTQELREKQEQLISIKEISETQGKMSELEELKEHLKAKDASLQRTESERLSLAEKLQTSQEEVKTIIKERNELQRAQEALQKERDQLRENIKELVAEVSLLLVMFLNKNSVKMIVIMFIVNLY